MPAQTHPRTPPREPDGTPVCAGCGERPAVARLTVKPAVGCLECIDEHPLTAPAGRYPAALVGRQCLRAAAQLAARYSYMPAVDPEDIP